MKKGQVKFFNAQKGFGFIIPEDGGQDVFVHVTDIMSAGGTLNEGDTVTYSLEETKKGVKASEVEVIS